VAAQKCETKGKGERDLLSHTVKIHRHRWATHGTNRAADKGQGRSQRSGWERVL